jgi:hypothetical protein
MPAITGKLTALGLAAAIGVGAAAAPATSLAKATGPGKYGVTAKSTYTFHNGPATGFDGTLFKGETFKVEKLSKSGKWAYGMAYGHVNRHAWVDASVLKAKK